MTKLSDGSMECDCSKRLVEDGPGATANEWFGCAAFSAVVTFILFAVVSYQVLYKFGMEADEAVKVARSGAALLAFGGAATTFFLVLYRSEITKQQVSEAKRQNDSKDEVELGVLLEKAVGLLKSEESSDLSLALTMLETITLAPNKKYALFALDFTADQIVRAHTYERGTAYRLIAQITRILENAKIPKGTIAGREIRFDLEELGEPEPMIQRVPFYPLDCYPIIKIVNASVTVDKNNESVFSWLELHNCNVAPVSAWVKSAHFRVDMFHDACTFTRLSIRELGSCLVRDVPNSFVNCVFSNAVIFSPAELKFDHFENCSYHPSTPPYFGEEGEYDDVDAPEVIKELGIDILENDDDGTLET